MNPSFIAPIALLTGVFSGIISFLGLWAIGYFLGKKFEPKMKPPLPVGVLIFSLIFKVPALLLGWQYSIFLGNPGPLAFGLGIVLVYCLAVAKLVLKSERQ